MNGLFQIKTPRHVLTQREQDPFLNMVEKLNKSPLLRPVYVNKKKYIKRCPSQVLDKIVLPPLRLVKKNKFSLEIPEIKKILSGGSDLKSTARFNGAKCYSELKILKLN